MGPSKSIVKVNAKASALVDALALVWFGVQIFSSLCDFFLPPQRIGYGVFTLLLSSLLVWAVLERKRWGRIALACIAGISFLNVGTLTLKTLLTQQIDPEGHMAGVWRSVLLFASANNPLTFGQTLVALGCLSFLSLALLLVFALPSVQKEFDSRKKRFLIPFQTGIALTLVAVWLLARLFTGVGSQEKDYFKQALTSESRAYSEFLNARRM